MPDIHVIDATKELGILRFLKSYKPPFEVIGNYRLIDDGKKPEATVQIRAGKQEMHEADVGVGPVDALANVLKKSLGQLFPDVPDVRLLDFEVHLIQGTIGTSAQVEVHIVFSDGTYTWKVSSTSDNINLASFRALLDGYEYAIYLWNKNKVQSSGSKVQGKTRTQRKTGRAKGEGRKAASPSTRRRGDTETRKKGTAAKSRQSADTAAVNKSRSKK